MKYLFLTDLLLELTFIMNLQVKIVMREPEACVQYVMFWNLWNTLV